MLSHHVVLTISHQRALRHLITQVCRRAGAETVTATSGDEAEALADHLGVHTLALVVMETAAAGTNRCAQPRMACHLLQEWATASPRLPFVFIGPVAHKPALLRLRADCIRFVATPVGLHALWEAIVSSLPRAVQQSRGDLTSYDQKGLAHGNRYHWSDYARLSRRDSAVQHGVARGAFFAARPD